MKPIEIENLDDTNNEAFPSGDVSGIEVILNSAHNLVPLSDEVYNFDQDLSRLVVELDQADTATSEDSDEKISSDIRVYPIGEIEKNRLLNIDEIKTSDIEGENFERVYFSLYPAVVSFLFRFGCAPEDVDRVYNEAMLKVKSKISSYSEGKGSITTWVMSIAVNTFIDSRRYETRRSRNIVYDQVESEEIADHFSLEGSVIDELQTIKLSEAIERAFSSLSNPDQARSIKMAYISGMTHKEISDALGEPLGTVKSRIRRGLMELGKLDELRSFLSEWNI